MGGLCELLEVRVGSIMSSPVVTVSGGTVLSEVVAEMYKSGVGSVVVVDDGSVRGIITRKDIVYLDATGVTKRNPKAREVMSTSIITASPHDTLQDIAVKMLETGIRHVPVVENGRLVGMVTLTDISRYILQNALSQCRRAGNI
ncbi:MAG: CBS domain-containing protein [Desulfurococcales archaeon]|nr:CBS domain-containing protein [Desulfurococcales archaeon]